MHLRWRLSFRIYVLDRRFPRGKASSSVTKTCTQATPVMLPAKSTLMRQGTGGWAPGPMQTAREASCLKLLPVSAGGLALSAASV